MVCGCLGCFDLGFWMIVATFRIEYTCGWAGCVLCFAGCLLGFWIVYLLVTTYFGCYLSVWFLVDLRLIWFYRFVKFVVLLICWDWSFVLGCLGN